MFKRLLAMTFAAGLMASAAHAEQPGEGDFALFLTQPFSSNSLESFGATGPTYNLGLFLSDDLMAYGSLRIVNADGNTNLGLGGGARLYQDFGAPYLRTFFDGNLSYTSLDDGDGSFNILQLGGFFGTEFNLAPRASLAVRVGATFTDVDGDFNILDLGAADVLLSVYF
ncbi:hypothetical protein [Isoalcanivorax indicus]|uniref:hypothetical protein n=1 Tax=Isoalcanivorax indicus TaxID=2202653 RepID=UPI000DBACBA1|nr:hypothetical protein [Isoalcanivorax indicus]